MENDFDWMNLRREFQLDWNYCHLSLCTVATHPHAVNQAINTFQDALNQNPSLCIRNHEIYNQTSLQAAAKYLETEPHLIALTQNTTSGLGLIYHGMKLTQSDEIITTIHDHYATREALRFKSMTSGCKLKTISLYETPGIINGDDIVTNLLNAINENTRLIALTWVHSSTGVKLPINVITQAIQSINRTRPQNKKILIAVDGVHALGIEAFAIDDLGCDFFIAGCHKSLYGPRGTGLVWAKESAWQEVVPIIPANDNAVFHPWLSQQIPEQYCARARFCSPGGFPNFEHRWALSAAFEFHLKHKKSIIESRVFELATKCKKLLLEIPGIKLHTPLIADYSSALICFEHTKLEPQKIVDKLLDYKVIAGTTPYHKPLVRFSVSILNSEQDLIHAVNALTEIIK